MHDLMSQHHTVLNHSAFAVRENIGLVGSTSLTPKTRPHESRSSEVTPSRMERSWKTTNYDEDDVDDANDDENDTDDDIDDDPLETSSGGWGTK